MKKKFIVLFMMILGLLLLGACKKEVDLKPVIEELMDIYQEGDSKDSVTKDLILETKSEIYPKAYITWESSNADVISSSGKVSQKDVDTDVNLTLTVKYNNQEQSESFKVKVIKKAEVVLNKYKLTIPNEITANVTNLNAINESTTIVLTVNVPTGKEINELKVNDVLVTPANNAYTFQIVKDTTVVVTFKDAETPTYTLTLPSEVSSNADDNGEIVKGTEVTLTINVPEGKEIDELKVNGEVVVTTDNKYVFEMVQNTTVEVTFKDIVVTYTLALPSEITSNADDNEEIVKGTEVTLTIDVPEGKEIDELKVNGEVVATTDNKYVFEMVQNTTVDVTFKNQVIRYSLTINEGLSADVTELEAIEENTEIVISISVPFGFDLTSFLVNGEEKISEIAEDKFTFTIVEDTEIEAIYVDSGMPVLTSKSLLIIDGNLVFEVALSDGNLEKLIFTDTINIFTALANEDNPYGESSEQFAQAGLTVVYQNEKWTITLDETGREGLISQFNDSVIIRFEAHDYAGNKYGSVEVDDNLHQEEIAIFTFTYNGDGEQKVFKYFENEIVVALQEEGKADHRFDGWIDDSTNQLFNFDEPITTNVVVTADYYQLQKFNVKYFNLYDATNENKELFIEDVTLVDAIREGFTFIGWYSDPTLATEVIEVTGDIDLYAKWYKEPVAEKLFETDFEDVTKGGYDAGLVLIDSINWNLSDTLINGQTNDVKNGSKALRIRNGYLESLDKIDGIYEIEFKYALYGNDADTEIIVEVSGDGTEWIIISQFAVTNKGSFETYKEVLNYEGLSIPFGGLFVKISNNGVERINIDDLSFNAMSIDDDAPTINVPVEDIDIDLNCEFDLLEDVIALDNCNGDITSLITYEIKKENVTVASIDWTTAGIYTVIYKVTDSSGNETSKEIAIDINDWNSPTLVIDESAIGGIIYVVGEEAIDLSVLVTGSNKYGPVDVKNDIEDLDIDWNAAGTYVIYYFVEGYEDKMVTIDLEILSNTTTVGLTIPDEISSDQSDDSSIEVGTKVTLTITIPTDKVISELIVGGTNVTDQIVSNQYVFTIYEDTTVTIVFQDRKMVVEFELDGGEGDFPPLEIDKGEVLERPTNDPTKDGYTFLYWALDDVEYTFVAIVNEDITLVAKWEETVEQTIITWKPTSQQALNGTYTFADSAATMSWVCSTSGAYIGFHGTYGTQFGSKNNPVAGTITFTIDLGAEYEVTGYEIIASITSSGNTTIGTNLSSDTHNLTTSSTSYVKTDLSVSTSTITIVFTSATRAFYIKSISISYI
ncbi:MAG: InlB B-repeat-containing protein [Acholeplasma sp.]|nr:InlB B-repeat-containing protein [Acholeplasma sp.]